MSEMTCWIKSINPEFEFPNGVEEVYRHIKKEASDWEKRYPGMDFHCRLHGFKSPPRTIKPISIRLK